MISIRTSSAALLALLALSGCTGGSKDPLIGIDVTGSVQVDGTAPAGYDLKLYAQADNDAAFDKSYCEAGEVADGSCFGRVDVAKLNTPLDAEVTWDGNSFTIVDVPVDLYYVLVATGDDDAIACTTDVVGYNEDTKLVTKDSAITISIDSSLTTFELPRKVRLYCEAPPTEPETPEEEEPEGEVPDGDIPEGEDPVASWTSFTVTDKEGTVTYADASTESVTADVDCGADFPEVLQIHATAENSATEKAYIRIQFGSGDAAEYRTIETPIVDGVIDQAISLTGGYSVIQLDLDENLDGVGESYNVTFCTPDDNPGQEMLTILTWDKDDTDVDTHIYNATNGTEVAYYSLHQDWGDLDIDDIDGFGPETFTSAPDAAGILYDVQVHYYSDHGNGDTTATMRVIYYDSSTQQVCDVTASQTMASYDWWSVGTFGPGMSCPD